MDVSYLFLLIKAFLVTVRYADASGVEAVDHFEAAEDALHLSSTWTLKHNQLILRGKSIFEHQTQLHYEL